LGSHVGHGRNIPFLIIVCVVASLTHTPACGSGREGNARHLRPSLQAAAERAVGKESACVIAIHPATGRILALVNEEMACRKAYPPGSILKLLTAFAGLDEGIVTPETTVECRNFHKSGTETLICSLPGGHGKVSLEDAIAHSCNVYFYTLGERLGPERLLKHFRSFGLGKRFGGYPHNQAPGSMPVGLNGEAEVAKAAIGQARDLRVTPLQMAVITAAIANGGTEYAPSRGKPSVLRRIHARPGTFEALRKGMRMAVVNGTAKEARVPGLSVCGKTGSPETDANPEFRHAWFVGFAPYDRPEIVVVVFAEWGHGGETAAPIARKVFEAYHDVVCK